MNPTVNFYGDELPHKEEINKQSICNTRFVASAHSGVKRFIKDLYSTMCPVLKRFIPFRNGL